MIRQATAEDIPAIKRLADANKLALGFVHRAGLLDGIAHRWLLVAEIHQDIVGFVHYRHRRNEQTTLYEIVVAETWRGTGLGRTLIAALSADAQRHGKAVIRLKTPDTLPANGFYQHLGFCLVGQETGRKRRLNIWEQHLKHHKPPPEQREWPVV